MNAPIKLSAHQDVSEDLGQARLSDRPTVSEAEAAVRTLIRWAGDDPDREGLIGTAFEEFKNPFVSPSLLEDQDSDDRDDDEASHDIHHNQ